MSNPIQSQNQILMTIDQVPPTGDPVIHHCCGCFESHVHFAARYYFSCIPSIQEIGDMFLLSVFRLLRSTVSHAQEYPMTISCRAINSEYGSRFGARFELGRLENSLWICLRDVRALIRTHSWYIRAAFIAIFWLVYNKTRPPSVP
jgi:hypothetical protein